MFKVNVFETETQEIVESIVVESMYVAKAIANGYAYDDFYTVEIV